MVMKMLPITQENSINIIEKAANGYVGIKEGISNSLNNISNLKDNVVESINIIADLSKMIIKSVDWFTTTVMNPIIAITFIDKLSIVVIMTLLILKMLGFNNLEKWIWLFVLVKIVMIAIM